MIVSGGPSAMTAPCAMTTTQSLMSRTMSMSCSTNSTVMPCSRRSLTCPSSDWVRAGLTPAIGSSSITSSGLTMRARAISSSLRWPPESEPAKSSRLASSLNRVSSSSARAVIASSWQRPRKVSSDRQALVGAGGDLVLLGAPQEGQHGLPEALARLALRPEPHVLQHGEPRQRLGELEGADHAGAGDLVRRHAVHLAPVERPLAGVGGV